MPILLKVFRRFFHSHKQMTDVLRKALGRCEYFKLSDPPFRALAPGSSVSLASAKTMFGPPEIERSCVSSLVMSLSISLGKSKDVYNLTLCYTSTLNH